MQNKRVQNYWRLFKFAERANEFKAKFFIFYCIHRPRFGVEDCTLLGSKIFHDLAVIPSFLLINASTMQALLVCGIFLIKQTNEPHASLFRSKELSNGIHE